MAPRAGSCVLPGNSLWAPWTPPSSLPPNTFSDEVIRPKYSLFKTLAAFNVTTTSSVQVLSLGVQTESDEGFSRDIAQLGEPLTATGAALYTGGLAAASWVLTSVLGAASLWWRYELWVPPSPAGVAPGRQLSIAQFKDLMMMITIIILIIITDANGSVLAATPIKQLNRCQRVTHICATKLITVGEGVS